MRWKACLAMLAAMMAFGGATVMTGCSESEPETPGEALDQAIEETGEAMEEAGDEMEDATN